jgi:hypothetical protein
MKLTLIAFGSVGTAGTCAWQCETVRAWVECACEAVCIALGLA